MLNNKKIDVLFTDFDGVLTDNNVYLDQNGNEMVCCSRADGLAFDVLRQTHLKLFILSTETNSVVSRRGEKLKIPVFQGIKDKQTSLEELSQHEGFSLAKMID